MLMLGEERRDQFWRKNIFLNWHGFEQFCYDYLIRAFVVGCVFNSSDKPLLLQHIRIGRIMN